MLIENFIIIIGNIMNLLGVGIAVYGGNLNRKAIESNGGFMPVYNPSHEIINNRHIPFWFKEDVKNFDLCDIYYRQTSREIVYYSKGDILINRGKTIFTVGFLVTILGMGGLFL